MYNIITGVCVGMIGVCVCVCARHVKGSYYLVDLVNIFKNALHSE